MSVVRNSLTIFVVDISASMGSARTVYEKVFKPYSGVEVKERKTTDLQWVCEFISARIVEIILRGLKTTKVALITYGSPRTNNTVVDHGGYSEGYDGIDEIFRLNVPTLDTLDLVQSLRAVGENDRAPPADPLAALVDAIQLSTCPDRGGIKESQKSTWTRMIYLITDGKSNFSWLGSDDIKGKIKTEHINVRVLGVDFDDEDVGFVEENKDATKRANEGFWHDFLAGIDTGLIATAQDAIEQASLPNVQLTSPSPSKSTLSFGDPKDLASKEAIAIPIAMYKMTEPQRPMTQSKISKLAQESAGARIEREMQETRMQELVPSSTPALAKGEADDEPAPVPSYRAETRRDHFLLEDIGRVEKGKGQTAQPLPEESVAKFTRAWKLGASLIPVPDEAFGQMDTMPGLEILHFVKSEAYRREYSLDQIWFVFPDLNNTKAQIQLASLVRGMHELELMAVVRLVRRQHAEPELGVLWPYPGKDYNCFYYSRVPFREDYRRFIFPPLDRIITKEGDELFEGPSIPTAEDQELFDEFVDSLDLMEVDGGTGENGQWFNILDSFNPAIHLLKDAVKHRFVHPESTELPGPHPELTKYFRRPVEVTQRSQGILKRCKERFKIGFIPPKNSFEKKKRLAHEAGQRQEAQGWHDAKKTKIDEQQAGQGGAPKRESGAAVRMDDGDDSETEDEDEGRNRPSGAAAAEGHGDDGDGDGDEEAIKAEEASQGLPLTQPSSRIGTDDPVEGFKRLVESEDDVTKTFVEMLDTISYLLRSREYAKVVLCCKEAKRVAQEYEEAIRWNGYIRQLKQEAMNKHTQFWDEHMAGRLEVGLVTEDEDEARQSDVSRETADEFVLSSTESRE
ncbi:uncharacterized protein PFL1_04537 [Pseudozyma flocculosa PF-1]|uniref:ATP-dependent DNA helicase II subunit 2 n=1 Tax=Pseudozyma flocculosa PF-1 TaxID=1277687 RepID=A0A061H4G8_9BASI|nr:uncharacterized protein PFL1_04537 [Pseudozyma flocculosa PF-1]EPQ27792.1 hypothetical protein PFL1_04537 [Pseudozyma flocculosa PF-1]